MKYNEYFESKKRGEINFIVFKDERPEELHELVRDIHLNHFYGCMPNDWIYSTICEAFEAFECNYDRDNWEDACYEIEGETRHYHLIEWLKESYASEFYAEYVSEYGESLNNIFARIGGGQIIAKERIYREVKDFLESREVIHEE
jgi:hypothetical protein